MTWIIALFMMFYADGADPDGVGLDTIGGDPDGVGIEQIDHVPNSTWGEIKKNFS